MERRLGRGLGSLLGGNLPELSDAQSGVELALDRIRPNPYQPRKTFDSEALDELRDSIKSHGILQPVVVRQAGEGFELVSGERRWRAARMAGLSGIPAVVRQEVSDEAMLELALVENIQRRDLDALEKARGYHEMIERLGLNQTQVADKVGIKRTTVANHLRLLDLPQKAQDALARGLIDMGHARALAGLKQEPAILRLLARTVREELSVRRLEKLVRENSAPSAKEPQKTVIPAAPWLTSLQKRMREFLGTRVSIQNGEGYRGQVVIRYHDRAELDRLCEVLAPRDEL